MSALCLEKIWHIQGVVVSSGAPEYILHTYTEDTEGPRDVVLDLQASRTELASKSDQSGRRRSAKCTTAGFVAFTLCEILHLRSARRGEFLPSGVDDGKPARRKENHNYQSRSTGTANTYPMPRSV